MRRYVKFLVFFLVIASTALNVFADSIKLPDAVSGVPYTVQLRILGVNPITASAAGQPAGLNINGNLVLAGTVNNPGAADQTYSFTVTFTDSSEPPNATTVQYQLHVAAPAATPLAAFPAPPSPPATPNQTCFGTDSSSPTITSNVVEGAKTVSGTAAQPKSTCTASIEIFLKNENGRPFSLGTADITKNTFTMQLSDALIAGQTIWARETATNSNGDPPPARISSHVEVEALGDWGRVKAYFTGGFLLSADQGSFSQDNLFLAFTLDKTWQMPGSWYGSAGNRGFSKTMGINTFFETRLTAVPVTSCTTPSSTSGTTPSQNQATPCTQGSGTTATPLETFISSRKTARLDVGAYFPFITSRWTFHGTPNALFLAPLAKVGFDTPVTDVSQNQPVNQQTNTLGTVTPVNPNNFYTFWGYGARLGHYSMTHSNNVAPELISYLDVIFGPFSNLESLVQNHNGTIGRKRFYRVAIEGILKVPSTPLIVGMSANVGQESLPGDWVIKQRAGDDLRFLFGMRFDVAKIVARIQQKGP